MNPEKLHLIRVGAAVEHLSDPDNPGVSVCGNAKGRPWVMEGGVTPTWEEFFKNAPYRKLCSKCRDAAIRRPAPGWTAEALFVEWFQLHSSSPVEEAYGRIVCAQRVGKRKGLTFDPPLDRETRARIRAEIDEIQQGSPPS